eukprot:TRINITY_DN9771_c0_g1_i1.p1 TRINITY_DN9771_c0_g1~~TRINITY_DN9771_c0_g1_i1.p1  ORF type:complete len:181 (-),score=15.67 TRINITY_DN9771_c0_g1_i1:117-659(-)
MDCTFPGTADERSSGSLLFPQANTAPRLDRTQRQNPHLLTSSCTGLFEKGLAPRWIELQQQQNPSGLPAGDRGGSSGARRYLYWKLQRASEEEGSVLFFVLLDNIPYISFTQAARTLGRKPHRFTSPMSTSFCVHEPMQCTYALPPTSPSTSAIDSLCSPFKAHRGIRSVLCYQNDATGL